MTQRYPWNWNLESYFTSIETPEYRAAWSQLEASADRLSARAAEIGGLQAGNVAAWAKWIVDFEALRLESHHMSSYLGCLTTADSLNETYKKEYSRFGAFAPKLRKATTLLETYVGKALVADLDALLAQPAAKGLDFPFGKIREEAKLALPPEQEFLLAELSVDGSSAWTRLYGQLTGRLTFALAVPGQPVETRGLAEARSLLHDGDPAVRRAALAGTNAAVAATEDVFAAALNALSGWRVTTYAKRGEASDIAPALRSHHVSLETVEAMFGAIRRRIELPRSFLRLKAQVLRLDRLAYHDLEAPFPNAEDRAYPWDEACELMLQSFGTHYPALHRFSLDALRNAWIDAEPRPGRRPGGFCSSSPKIGQSRIFMSYGGRLGDMQTLAHELGHAYHGFVLNGTRPLLRSYPSTLAETASTFAQILVAKDLAADPRLSAGTRQQMLVTLLNDDAAFCLNIFMRYEFEKKLMRERKRGDLSVSTLKAMMTETQAEIYGDALDPAQLDPYFWATKLHFYGYSFYNYPYTFGYLLSRIFIRRLRERGPEFLTTYEEFLRGTGSYSCEELVGRTLNQDIRTPEFWNQALDEIELDLTTFRNGLAAG